MTLQNEQEHNCGREAKEVTPSAVQVPTAGTNPAVLVWKVKELLIIHLFSP